MENSENFIMFRFILPINLRTDSSKSIPPFAKVYATTSDDMNLFLKQHNLLHLSQYVEPVHPYVYYEERTSNHLLGIHKFKSNKSDKIFSIMTTLAILDTCTNMACVELSNYCLFGEAIMRRDIPIFRLITDLVDDIPYLSISDFGIADDWAYSDENMCDSIMDTSQQCCDLTDMYKRAMIYSQNNYYDTTSVEMYWEECYSNMIDMAFDQDKIKPITIECYVSSFIDLLTDDFN